MPFKSDKQKRLFGACMNPKFRAKRRRQGQSCPPEHVIRKFFAEDRKAKRRKKGRKKR
jgi:hypothetical protein